MRILLLSFPPDISEDMRDAQFRFERAANKISKATAGYRRDLPVEIDPSSVTNAKTGWDEGRIALNEFFVLLNTAVGLDELTSIPPPGPNQNNVYGRSARRYNELQKKIKLCQNRGGPALSQAWGKPSLDDQLIDPIKVIFTLLSGLFSPRMYPSFLYYSILIKFHVTQDNSWCRVTFRTVVEFLIWTSTFDRSKLKKIKITFSYEYQTDRWL